MLWFHLLFACLMAQQPTDPKDLAVVEGRVLGADGAGLKKVNLNLQVRGGKPGEPSQSYGAVSDSDGKFIFDGVEPGKYMLSGYRTGYLSTMYGARSASNGGTILTLTTGQHMSGVNFPLTPQSGVSGRVVDEDGDPAGFIRYSFSVISTAPTGNGNSTRWVTRRLTRRGSSSAAHCKQAGITFWLRLKAKLPNERGERGHRQAPTNPRKRLCPPITPA
jgi:hypothetical protein